MKKARSILVTILVIFSFTACSANASPSESGKSPFPGKIAIVTDATNQSAEETYAAMQMIDKYGADKILHYTWPDNFMEGQAQMNDTMAEIAANRDVKAVLINQAVFGTNRAVDRLRGIRKDIFVVYCQPTDNVQDVAARADLVLLQNHMDAGPAIAAQAKAQGAKVLVHYSFPRHMSMHLLAYRRDRMRETFEESGLKFVDAMAPDPTSNVGLAGAQHFILEDVPKKIAEYGTDTAFYSTNCGMQAPLIRAVVDNRGIYPQPCCPTPFHGFPEALGIEISDGYEGYKDLSYVISETKRTTAERGLTGRLSTWPVPVASLFTQAATEYIVKWLNSEVPDVDIDKAQLLKACEDYVQTATGIAGSVDLRQYHENGITYNNVYTLLLGYLVY